MSTLSELTPLEHDSVDSKSLHLSDCSESNKTASIQDAGSYYESIMGLENYVNSPNGSELCKRKSISSDESELKLMCRDSIKDDPAISETDQFTAQHDQNENGQSSPLHLSKSLQLQGSNESEKPVDTLSNKVVSVPKNSSISNSSVQIVVWSKTKKKKQKNKSSADTSLQKISHVSSDKNLFIVNYAKRKLEKDKASNEKATKSKRNKTLEFVTEVPRHPQKRKSGQVKLSKPAEYKRYIQSYISSRQRTSQESKKMKENGDANLNWLLDFKVDTLFQQEESFETMTSTSSQKCLPQVSENMEEIQSEQTEVSIMNLPKSINVPVSSRDPSVSSFDPSNPEHAFTVDLAGVDNVANFEQVESQSMSMNSFDPDRRVSTIISTTEIQEQVYTPPPITFDEQGKPRCTYTDLIERALTESGGLTVSEIYQWISDNYSFFRADDDRWKNSVRHNLSINPYFKKGEKARSGAGHLWTISEESRALRPALRKRDNEYEEITMLIENDIDRAVASILGQYNLAKANMEGRNHPDELCAIPTCDNSINSEQIISTMDKGENQENGKIPEVTPVFVEYEPTNEFSEFTIELSGLNIPDSGAFEFQDLLSSGRLILIRTEDQDSDKENMRLSDGQFHNLDDYNMVTDFSTLHNSTETERVSGQLISEALTHEFESIKHQEKSGIQESIVYQNNCNQFERLNTTVSDSSDFMVLDSIDPMSLQEVIQGSNDNSSEHDQYQQIMNTINTFEPKDLGYCDYENEVTL